MRQDRKDTKKLVKKDSRNIQLARFASTHIYSFINNLIIRTYFFFFFFPFLSFFLLLSEIKDQDSFTADEKRVLAQITSQRNKQLKNPNVHVSPLRIVVNNLSFNILPFFLSFFFSSSFIHNGG